MSNPKLYFLPCMDTNDLFVKTGFCPAKILITNLTGTTREEWYLPLGNDGGISIDNTGDPTLNTDKGIKLVKFTQSEAKDETTDPTAYEVGVAPYECNGFQITSDSEMLSDDAMLAIEVWPYEFPLVKAIHDGGSNSNTYLQDASIDFIKAGVSEGWIVYNQSNGNYAYVKEITKPVGQKNYCRVYTCTDSATKAATTAADFDDNDVVYLFPANMAAYPLSDIGAMT